MAHPNRLIDIAGQQFGHWTVLCRGETRHGQTHWLCRCKCGYEATVHGQRLRQGDSKSCGCGGRASEPRARAAKTNEHWSQAELDAIRRYYPVSGTACLKWTNGNEGISPRSRGAIRRKAARLGVHCARIIIGRKDVWSEREIEMLRQWYPEGGLHAVLPHVGKNRSKLAIKQKADSLGLKPLHRFWSKEEDALLRKWYRTRGAKGLLPMLKRRSQSSIRARALKLGLPFFVVNYWSKEEDQILRELYPPYGAFGVQMELPHRTRTAIILRAKRIGLRANKKLLNYLDAA